MSDINIVDYGACGNGKIDCTEIIQLAIERCENGDRVIIPRGTFLTGAIFLKSNMTLVIEYGACLLGTKDLKKYPLMKYRFEGCEQLCHCSLINTDNKLFENITIEGGGEIDASGEYLCFAELNSNCAQRGRAVCMMNVRNLIIRNVTIRQSPSWCLHLLFCKEVIIDNVHINTQFDKNGLIYKNIINGDGIDIDSCERVKIVNTLVASQDDCISVKSGKNKEGRDLGRISKDILIENCSFQWGCGISIGSEMSGGVKNVRVIGCKFTNVLSIASIKTQRGRGGIVQDVSFQDCVHTNYDRGSFDRRQFWGVIYMNAFYKNEMEDTFLIKEVTEETPIVKDIYFRNLSIDTIKGNAIYVCGLPESPFENIRFVNIKARCEKGLEISNASHVKIDKVSIVTVKHHK